MSELTNTMMTPSNKSETEEQKKSELTDPAKVEEAAENPKLSDEESNNINSIGPDEIEMKKSDDAQNPGNKVFAANATSEVSKLAPTLRRDMNRFPEKLMRILDSEEYIDIFSWSKSGKSIVIHQPYELISKVLVKHFDAKEDMKFDSFLRKLYRWGFSKKTADEEDGDEEGAHIYIHNHFQKSKLDECINVVCTSKPTSSRPPNKRGSYNMYYSGYQAAGMPYSAQPQPMIMMNGGIYQHTGTNMIPGMGNPVLVAPTDRASVELMMTQQDRREREMLLMQQQQMALRNGSSALPMMTYAGGSMPYYSAGGASAGVGPLANGAARLGDEINRFEQRRLAGLQQTGSMTPGLNAAASPVFPSHSDIHRRVMMEAQAGLMRPLSNHLTQSRDATGARDDCNVMEGSGNRGEDMLLHQKYNMLISQQQSSFDNMQKKRDINAISGIQSEP